MKIFSLVITAVLLFGVGSSCAFAAAKPHEDFAIYLSSDGKDAAPVIAQDDIISFHWAKQTFTLKSDATKRLPKPAMQGTDFIAKVGELTVYKGKFVTLISSFAIPGPVIVVDPPSDKTVYSISLDYPGTGITEDRIDARWNPIIRDALEKAGKLTDLPEAQAHCEWLVEALQDVQKIKPGTTRTEVYKLFSLEGGLQGNDQQRLVWSKCHYIKLDVTFTDHDVVQSVSQPYLGYMISD